MAVFSLVNYQIYLSISTVKHCICRYYYCDNQRMGALETAIVLLRTRSVARNDTSTFAGMNDHKLSTDFNSSTITFLDKRKLDH